MSFLSNAFKNAFGFLRNELMLQRNTFDRTKHDSKETKNAKRLRRKRGSSEEQEVPEVITKRRRVDRERYAPIVNGEVYESTAIEASAELQDQTNQSIPREDLDRAMMPPPLLTPNKSTSLNRLKQIQDEARFSVEPDNASQTSYNTKSTRLRVTGDLRNDYDMERARRHAAATTLPANSGAWERGEKELFYHLAYRGFEPLLPANWMKDFPTLPLSLYATDDDHIPLIQNNRTREFRAIRELRELLEIGRNVRDGVLASPGIRRENIIEKACLKYISWAFLDAGLKLPSYHKPTTSPTNFGLPVHVVVTLKTGQSTTDCLSELKHKLHVLAMRHRQSHNIQMSVERDQSYCTPETEDRTFVLESHDDDLPTLYGIMICRSILAIFTMNSQTPLPRNFESQTAYFSHDFPTPAASTSPLADKARRKSFKKQTPKSVHENDMDVSEDDSASDPRFISDFDFSNASRDVWNALVIAILAMQVRTDMLILNRAKGIDQNLGEAMENMSRMEVDSDDPDA